MGGKPRFGSFLIMNLSSVTVFQIDVDGIPARLSLASSLRQQQAQTQLVSAALR
jgi:hypothetical protein